MGGRKAKGKGKGKCEDGQKGHEEIRNTGLPEEINMQILTKIPAYHLWENIRFVCKSWHDEISSSRFIYKHNMLHQKSCGILIQPRTVNRRRTNKFNTYFLEMTDQNKFDFKSNRFGEKRMGYISSSYNGLILETVFDIDRSSVLHLKNIVTGFDITLPNCPSGCRHIPSACGLALGFNPDTKQYKLVHIYADGYGFELFTIGVDKAWRRVPAPIRSYHINSFRWSNFVSVGGQFLHWFVNHSYMISMDIWDEKFSKTDLPYFKMLASNITLVEMDGNLVEMDGKLCLVHTTSDTDIDVWVLKDFSREVWSNVHTIDANSTNYLTLKASKEENKKKDKDQVKVDDDALKDILPKFLNLRAVATLKNGAEIMFQHKNIGSQLVYIYSTKRREMRKLKTNSKGASRFIPHHGSLVSL